MSKFHIRLIVFLFLTFGGLAIGGLFTGEGVPSEWYQTINKAPWTPPGWVFGAAWFTIMVCYSLFMAVAYEKIDNVKFLMQLFVFQWVLNVAWNPLFFYLHWVASALIVITMLTFLMIYFMFKYKKEMGIGITALIPYTLWLIIATSLNAYIFLYN
jgi:tryptophan-rich sensory protein